jgi:catechol 2,3-dioxygenase-like lactoylglutathione lyase family enzyme
MMAELEHVNVTVPDPKVTAAMLMDLFGWHVRWEGPSMEGTGYTVHVGSETSYVALYTGPEEQVVPKSDASYITRGGLNHLGVVVDDLEAVEAKVKALGLETHSHADYEPGKRFYFHDPDGVEIEVICYA